ncbi:MAG: hydroxymyristoyl-ACP dehydratase [Xanthomonadaceae bacterium]|nr:hydroxymyristoyl-ACP dehydratase [Xanthomonadaceae bacterium]MDE2245879.1 hydroxymyristoyl-ACP dehydratase [Xanthomonadaceae bacterium]
MSEFWCSDFSLPHGHPALPGHFPGQPRIPGVLLLEQAALALRAWRGVAMAGVIEAKFLAALQPGLMATIELHADGARVRFAIRQGTVLIARGLLDPGA